MFTFIPENYIGGGHQKISIADTVVSLFISYLTLIKPTTGTFAGKHATGVKITIVTNPIYITFDGSTPATDGTSGHPYDVGAELFVEGWDNVKLLKFIRQGSSSGSIMLTPYFSRVGVNVPDPS